MPSSQLSADLAGRRYRRHTFSITADWVRRYKKALGFSPEEQEEDFFPTSFIACLRDGPWGIFEDLGLELRQLLHAGQKFRYYKEPRVGEDLHTESEILKVLKKETKAGVMTLLEIQTDYFSQDEELIIQADMVVFVKEKADG